ncbi:MAG: PKD domain-containing protein [Bacteroidota bacterium]|nr:PKD domain-containing protein [Cytophagales bacterium]
MSFNRMQERVSFLKQAIYLLIACCAISTISFSQNLSQHNWYFGSTPDGIRFNRGSNQAKAVTDQAIPFGTGGSAVVTDPATANLLFYTDGSRVYDATHRLMPNGSGLSANTAANQPVVVCPVPGQANKYFIFTNNANFTTGGSINRSVVDMALFGNAVFPSPGLGNVETANKNVAVPGLSNRSEAMMVIAHANGTDFWLITHQNGSSNFMTTQITAASYASGTFNTIVNSIAGPAGALPLSVSNFSYNHKLRKIAVSTQSPNDDAQILNFDPATGNITFDRYILNTGLPTTQPQSIYDIQWDIKGGQYLYISRVGEAGINADVLQYDYTSSNPGTPTTVITSLYAATGTTLPARSYGLQLAPDSAIYHIYQASVGGPFLVDKFTKTDTIAAFVRVTRPFGNTNFAGTQFPSFLPRVNPTLTVSFTTSGTPRCQNNPITFFPNVTPGADSLVWNFGDGSPSSRSWSPVHRFVQNQPSFNVQLTAFYQGQRVSATQPVTITPFDLRIQLVQDTTACRSEFPPPRGTSSPTRFSVTVKVTQGTATTFNWSNGQTGATLRPDSAGYYYVVVGNGTGCSTYAGVNVKEYGLNDRRSNIWYFGNKAGIDFNKQPAVALNNSAMNAPAGCAIVCDRNGRTIFYTDGTNVYDKTNTLIDTGIGGDPTSTQSSLIVSVPGDETIYYIFTTQEITGTSLFELRYSVFDLKLNGGNGQVTQKNVFLFSKSTERITSNGRWLVAHEYGNSTFRTYRITNQGIGPAVYSDIGSVHSFGSIANGQGYMKLGPRSNLAVALSTPGTSNILELFQLNDTTGVLRNYRKVDMNQPNGQVYGVEFSPGGRKLFATVKGNPSPSELFEYSIDSLERVRFKQKVSKPNELGALQVGPDGQIYMAYNDATNNNTLGNFRADEDTLRLTSLGTITGFALADGTNSRLGLPNFVQQQGNGFGGPSFTFTGVCLGDTTKFNGTPTDAIDKFQWAFGDGAGSTVSAPNHVYAAPGTYTVSMRLTNRCGLDTTLVRKVTINPPAPRPTIPLAISLCNGPLVLDAGPASRYAWNTGASSRTINVNNVGRYTVSTVDANGCAANAATIVANNRPVLNLGPPTEVCQNNSVANLDAQNIGLNYLWTLNGAPNGNTSQTQAVDTTTPAVLTYGVTVTDPITNCVATANRTITVKVSPSFTLSGVNPTCGAANGSLTVTLNATTPTGGPYSYFVSGPSFNQTGIDQTAPATLGPFAGRVSGTYSGIVTDQVSGCTISNAFGLVDAAFTASATFTNCDPSVVTVATAGPTVGALQYTFTPVAGGPVVGPQASNIATLPVGDYQIQVRDNGGTGCTFVFPKTISTTVTPPVIQPNLCVNPANLQVTSGGTAFNWTLPGGSTVAGNPLTVTTGGTYRVDVTLASGCIVTNSITINYNGPLTPNFTQSDGCATSVLLSATPVGAFTYRWYRAGVLVPLGGNQVTVTTADDGVQFAVEVVDASNGCVVRSAAKAVQVSGPVDATLTATQACDDGKDFTLTAGTSATGVTYSWFFNNSTTPIANATSATLSQNNAGTYRVRVSKATCFADANIQIIKAPIPLGQLIDRAIICADRDNLDPATNQVDLNPGRFVSYNWFKDGNTLGYTNQIFTATSEGLYRVDLTNSFGCVNADETEVLNECLPKIVGPNAFRPGSDVQYTTRLGTYSNKEFFVYSFFVTDNFEVAIYNRWGELVFQSKDRGFKWNGGYNNNPGQPLPGGTYTYVIRYQSSFRPQDGVKEQRGGVVLLR